MANRYQISEIGIGQHCYVGRPDTKFNTDGVFKTKLILEGDAAEREVAKIDAIAQDPEARAAAFERWKIKDWKKWKADLMLPYEWEADDDGNPTGRVIIRYKQNAIIRLQDGEEKRVVIGVVDGRNKTTKKPVFGGATIRVMWAARLVPVASNKQLALRLDFAKVQLIKPAPDRGGGFDEVEGAWADDDGDDVLDTPRNQTASAADDAEY